MESKVCAVGTSCVECDREYLVDDRCSVRDLGALAMSVTWVDVQ